MERLRPSSASYTFLLSCLGLLFIARNHESASYGYVVWTAITVLACACVALAWKKTIAQRPVQGGSVRALIALAGGSLALLLVQRHAYVPSAQSIDRFFGERITAEGIISAEPDRRPMQIKYTIDVTHAGASADTLAPADGRLLFSDRSGWPEYAYGDRVRVTGKLEKPGDIDGFAYDNYLRIFGISALLPYGGIQAAEGERGGSVIRAALYRMKHRFEAQINRVYPEPHASFLAGLLTGSRKGIPTDLMEHFNITGLTHIIAISGYNITIIIVLVSGLLFWLPLRWRFAPMLVAIAFFTLFVGASASVVRAAIMGGLGLFAIQAGRQTHPRLLILWTAFLMSAWNPAYLWYDAGFQLSFLAVIGLTELSPVFTRMLARVPDTLGMRTAFVATMAAQVATLPLILLLFRRLSIVAPVANLLAAPLIPLAMLFGFVGTVTSTVWFPLGQLLAYPGWGCLQLIILTARTLSGVPYASLSF